MAICKQLQKKKSITLILILFSFVTCHHDYNKIFIQGNLENNIYKKVYLSKITSDGVILIDSTEILKGKFSFKIRTHEDAPYPELYQLSLSLLNSMTIIAKPGDYLQIAADAKNLVKSYTITGSDDSKRMFQLDKMLTTFIDSLDVLYAFYEQHIENDDIRADIDTLYCHLLSQYSTDLVFFIKQNSESMVTIPAFYQVYNRRQFLDEQENLDILQLIHHDLKKKYPDSENVKFLEQRISKLKEKNE